MKYATYHSLARQRVLITGGGTGIGAAMVAAFAGQGAQVFFIDIAVDASQELAESLKHEAFAPVFLHCDLTDIAAVQTTIAGLEADGGGFDVLVNNAANDDRHGVADVTADYWDQRMAVNLRHQFFCAQAVAKGMAAKGGGSIINFGSISWHLALPNLSLYMTAKAAIEGLTRGLARDFGPDRIRVNTIIPGGIRTPRQQQMWHSPEDEAKIVSAQCLPETVTVEDCAALALFLGSDNAARCSGRDYYVDAGWYGA